MQGETLKKLHRGVVGLGVAAVVAAALVAPGVQAAPGVGVPSTPSAVFWDDAQQVGGSGGTVAGGFRWRWTIRATS